MVVSTVPILLVGTWNVGNSWSRRFLADHSLDTSYEKISAVNNCPPRFLILMKYVDTDTAYTCIRMTAYIYSEIILPKNTQRHMIFNGLDSFWFLFSLKCSLTYSFLFWFFSLPSLIFFDKQYVFIVRYKRRPLGFTSVRILRKCLYDDISLSYVRMWTSRRRILLIYPRTRGKNGEERAKKNDKDRKRRPLRFA